MTERTCPTCGGTILAPTRTGTPRGTCHCDANLATPAPAPDPDVPTVTGLKTKDGWRYGTGLEVRGRRETVIISPDGTEYLIATGNERADLLVDLSAKRLPNLRLRLLHGSGRAKEVKRAAREQLARQKARETALERADSKPRTKVRRK